MSGNIISVKQEQTDRRSRRSRRLIADALFALMQEKLYHRITVQEIIDRADVGRSTFYAHYRSKEDVLVSGIEQMLAQLHAQLLASEALPAGQLLPSLGLFRHVAEMLPAYHALVRGGSVDMIYDAFHRNLREHAARRLAELVKGGYTLEVPAEILADYLAGAFLTLLRWWLDHGLPYSPEQMHATFQRLASPGVQLALRPSRGEHAGRPE
jgi:AcrR family transcriptional regulator